MGSPDEAVFLLLFKATFYWSVWFNNWEFWMAIYWLVFSRSKSIYELAARKLKNGWEESYSSYYYFLSKGIQESGFI